MLKVENTDVFGWKAAIRGMRNPMNSWDKSDSQWKSPCTLPNQEGVYCEDCTYDACRSGFRGENEFAIGPNDLNLMKNLSKAGNDHGKFLRMINVTVDIIAPLYWWKEFDTYKVGTVANSCSTMHKIHTKEFEMSDFSIDHMTNNSLGVFENYVFFLETVRKNYMESKSKDDWYDMIQLLPSSYNQKRTIQFNYQVLKTMYNARCNHKLDEWHTLCDWMLTLPYFKEICLQGGDTNE
jgi:hypothetical protein